MGEWEDFCFRSRRGELLIKYPGSVNGQSFVLDKLEDCEVYILDYISQVQIDDCINCKIFVGPTDGSVFLRDCRDCTVCVAARQLRTRDCRNLDIALYCATQPSIETSVGLVFSCWRGAYPGLGEHFRAARLDPTRNTWSKVYDFNAAEDLGGPHFILDESVRPWWIPPPPPPAAAADGAAAPPPPPPDCPVPAADGSLYGGGRLDPPPPPKSPGSLLPDSLPPSPGRAAAHDEEIELSDEDEGVAEGVEEAEGAVRVDDDGEGVDGVVEPDEPPPVLLQPPPPPQPGAGAGADGLWAGPALDATQPPPPQPQTVKRAEVQADAGEASQPFSFGSAAEAAPPPPGASLPGAVSGPLDADFFADAPAALLPPPPSAPAVAVYEAVPAPPSQPLMQPPQPALPVAAADPFFQPAAGDNAAAPLAAAPIVADAGLIAAAGTPALPPPAPTDSAIPAYAAAAASASASAAAAAADGDGGGDARVAWRARNAAQLAAAAREEGAARAALRDEARRRLDALQQTRAALLRQRYATNREHEKATTGGPAAGGAAGGGGSSSAGGGRWGRVLAMVDLSPAAAAAAAGARAAGRAGGGGGGPSKDTTRLRQLMVALKSRPGAHA